MTNSIISPKALIAPEARIGNFCTIHDNVVIEGHVEVGDYTTLGEPSALADGSPLHLRDGTKIRSYSVFYEGSSFGPGLVTGHRVTVREGTQAGAGFQIGTLSDIQGHCRFGDHVRTHSNVHVGQKSVVGNYVWLFPYVVLTNDPHPPSEGFMEGVHLHDYCVIATHACVMPGVVVGEDALVAAGALVAKDVAPGRIVGGVPAKDLGDVKNIKLRDDSGRSAYPWREHFHRGYPTDVVEGWLRGER